MSEIDTVPLKPWPWGKTYRADDVHARNGLVPERYIRIVGTYFLSEPFVRRMEEAQKVSKTS